MRWAPARGPCYPAWMGSPPSSAPRASRPPKGRGQRPWYLLLSLVASWLLGAMALMSGGSVIAFFREDANELRESLDRDESRLSDEGERALFKERSERLNEAHERARRREFPLGVATLVLGGAMVAMSARAMSGREGARGALVQVTLARVALIGVAFALTPDVRAAEFGVANVLGYLSVGKMGFEALACLLVVVALTRQGSRAFFGADEGSVWER
jgi:hypothetical protein